MECKTDQTRAYVCMLLVTDACNLNCVYCYENNKSNKSMTLEVAQRAIRNAFEKKGFDYVSIQFMGGEPLLGFPLMKEISEWMWDNEFSKPYELFASTNGTLLNDEMKQWFSKNKDRISLGLSFDGVPMAQDLNRSQSSRQIDFSFFLETWPNMYVKMTVSVDTIQYLYESVVFLEESGFLNIKTDLAYMKGWQTNHLRIWNEELKKLVTYYADEEHKNHCSLLDTKIEAVFAKNVSVKRCGCGEDIVCVDTDGKEYPCQMYAPISMSKQLFNTVKDIDFSDEKNFEIPECQQCILHSCCPACSGCNLKYNGAINKLDSFYCKAFVIQFMRTLDYRYKIANKIADETVRNDTLHDLNEIANVITIKQ